MRVSVYCWIQLIAAALLMDGKIERSDAGVQAASAGADADSAAATGEGDSETDQEASQLCSDSMGAPEAAQCSP